MQNRPPPCFQMYASDMMAKTEYRIMTLADRGLLLTLLNELWVNHNLPADPKILAKVLGFEIREIETSLRAVMPFLMVDGDRLFSPELEDYRAHLASARKKMSDGGKRAMENRRKPAKPDE